MKARPKPPRAARIFRPLFSLVLAALLAGCGSAPGKAATGQSGEDPEVEEARSDMEDSRAEYEGCLRDQDEYDDLDCDLFKEIYEEDREAYERVRKAAQARR